MNIRLSIEDIRAALEDSETTLKDVAQIDFAVRQISHFLPELWDTLSLLYRDPFELETERQTTDAIGLVRHLEKHSPLKSDQNWDEQLRAIVALLEQRAAKLFFCAAYSKTAYGNLKNPQSAWLFTRAVNLRVWALDIPRENPDRETMCLQSDAMVNALTGQLDHTEGFNWAWHGRLATIAAGGMW